MVVIVAAAVALLLVIRHGGDTARRDQQTDPDSLFRQFNHLVYTERAPGSLDLAERLLRAALDTHPRKDQVLAQLGHLELERATRTSNVKGTIRPSKKARERFREALAINPKNLDALRGLASFHEYGGQPHKAIAMDDRIIAAFPRNLHARTHKGRCLLMMRQYARAATTLEETLALAQRVGDVRAEVAAREHLGKVYTRQRRYALAEKMLVKAVDRAEAAGVMACPYAALGELYRVTGRQKKVAQVHMRAADVESNKPMMQYHAAEVCDDQGDYDNALKYIRRAIALRDDPRYRKLEQSIQAALKPSTPADRLRMALAAFSDDNFEKAEAVIDRALKAGGATGKLEVVKGFILLLQKRYPEAEKLFASAGAVDSKDHGARAGLGHLAIIRKKYDQARALLDPGILSMGAKLERMSESEGANSYLWLSYRMSCLGMGWVSANTGKHAAALVYFDRILDKDPDCTFALLGKGNSLNAMGKLDRAEKYLSRVLALDPKNRFAMAELALVKYNRGQDAESERLFKAALQGDPRKYTCPHEGLGMIYLRAGKLDKARASFRKAIKINPDIEFKKFNGLARILIKEGKYAPARKLLRKSMDNYPHDDEARKLLASIRGK